MNWINLENALLLMQEELTENYPDWIKYFEILSFTKKEILAKSRKILKDHKLRSDIFVEAYDSHSIDSLHFVIYANENQIGRLAYRDLERFADSCPFKTAVDDLEMYRADKIKRVA